MEKFAYVPSTHDGRTIVNYSHPQDQSISGHYHNDPQPGKGICDECFAPLIAEPVSVAVVNPDTGQHGIVHESCFLANDDVLERE